MMPSMDDEETDDLSTCAVCFSEFDDNVNRAKFLSCAHTFCLECLKVSRGTSSDPNCCVLHIFSFILLRASPKMLGTSRLPAQLVETSPHAQEE